MRRILIVDDDLDVADSLVLLLETYGASARATYGGAAGLEAVATFKPQVVLLDLGMPEIDGFETARRIRALPEGLLRFPLGIRMPLKSARALCSMTIW